MELITATRRYLKSVPAIAGYVGDKVFKYEIMATLAPIDPAKPGTNPPRLAVLNGTGGLAIVVTSGNGWLVPEPTGSAEYPTLRLELWADCTRDANGLKIQDDAVDKAYALYRVVDKAINQTRAEWWGAGGDNPGLWVLWAGRAAEPYHETESDEHTMYATDGVRLQDCARVVVSYNVKTTH